MSKICEVLLVCDSGASWKEEEEEEEEERDLINDLKRYIVCDSGASWKEGVTSV